MVLMNDTMCSLGDVLVRNGVEAGSKTARDQQ
jgi:hypothetical protein